MIIKERIICGLLQAVILVASVVEVSLYPQLRFSVCFFGLSAFASVEFLMWMRIDDQITDAAIDNLRMIKEQLGIEAEQSEKLYEIIAGKLPDDIARKVAEQICSLDTSLEWKAPQQRLTDGNYVCLFYEKKEKNGVFLTTCKSVSGRLSFIEREEKDFASLELLAWASTED